MLELPWHFEIHLTGWLALGFEVALAILAISTVIRSAIALKEWWTRR